MTKTELGKIESVSFGHGGYQDAMLGLTVSLTGNSWGTNDHKGFWAASIIECSEYCKWTEQDRDASYAEVMRFVDKLLAAAKKRNIADLKGVPIEATFEGNMLKSWRVLTEVL